jgi:hypothetical protein
MMELKPKFGVDKLLFGMKVTDVKALYGLPDSIDEDEDGNQILIYNTFQWKLTFYEDEGFKMGYIVSTNPELTYKETSIINNNAEEMISLFKTSKIESWEIKKIDGNTQFFNESNWLLLHEEFGKIIKIELGAVFNHTDEFDWKFR